MNPAPRLTIAILYDPWSTHTRTVQDYLEAFGRYSRHEVHYVAASAAVNAACGYNLAAFDVICIHYSIRLPFGVLPPSFADALIAFKGLKCLFIQDEYDLIERTRCEIERLGIGLVFTNVPADQLALVYPPARFARVGFVQVLTGYVPEGIAGIRQYALPPSARSIEIGYRGRLLPFWYGRLGHEKWLIGARMKQLCRDAGIVEDIAWDEQDRIYGDDWYAFLGRCVATLGTETGCNVFDDDGSLRATMEGWMREHPQAGFEEVWSRFMADREGRVRMNQISPKLFEAIATGTVLILFEGGYSGVIEADTHYIALRRDFSNVDDVFTRLRSPQYVQAMAARAYADVIESGRYSYLRFVAQVDEAISARARRVASEVLVSIGLIGADERARGRGREVRPLAGVRAIPGTEKFGALALAYLRGAPTSLPLGWPDPRWLVVPTPLEAAAARLRGHALRTWERVPAPARAVIAPLAATAARVGTALEALARLAWHAIPRPVRMSLAPAGHRVLRAIEYGKRLIRGG
ncbi:MAG: hypothetical protein AB7Q97_13060 [Gammaproteobacteria bacterium]